jgi:hypothetical protein
LIFIFVNQEKCSTKVLDRFGLKNCKAVKSPDETAFKLSEADSPKTEEGKKERNGKYSISRSCGQLYAFDDGG